MKAPTFFSRQICANSCMEVSESASFVTRRKPWFLLDIERPQAGCAAWYELFPRRPPTIPRRHGTFERRDRPPAAIQATWALMFFICRRSIRSADQPQRQEQQPARRAPDDVGSPYAIGSARRRA